MNSAGKLDLKSLFKQYFEIVPAFSATLKEEVYRIRHQVYCEELKFETEKSDKREIDEYDDDSLHLLIRSVKTGEFVGCTRIIHPSVENPSNLLPFEKACINTLDRTIVDPAKLPRHKISEVSRLAVIASFRKRKSDARKTSIGISNEDFGTANQPRFPYIPVSLYLGTTKLAHYFGIEYVFVLTEKRLAQHFHKLGFELTFIGNPIEHHGKRVPSMLSVNGTIKNMHTSLLPLYNTIATDIEADIPDDLKNQIMPHT